MYELLSESGFMGYGSYSDLVALANIKHLIVFSIIPA